MRQFRCRFTVCGLAVLMFLAVAWASVPAGDAAIDAGDYRAAVDAYKAAYEANRAIEALYKLARAQVYLAEVSEGETAEQLYEEAVTHARQATEMAPELAEAHFEVARAVGRLAQFQGVLEALNLAAEVEEALSVTLELNPNHGGAYHALAMWHLEVPWIAGGRRAQVKPLFEKALSAEPGVIAHRVGYAEALLRLEESDLAREQLEAALAMTPATVRDEADLAEAQELLSGL